MFSFKIKPEDGVSYTTRFIGTRKNFKSSPDKAKRNSTEPSDAGIGVTLGQAQSLEPSYTFKGDELYVRAEVTSSKKKGNPLRRRRIRTRLDSSLCGLLNNKRVNVTKLFLLTALGVVPTSSSAAGDSPADYQPEAQRLTHAATNSVFGFTRLATMCDTFGPRFTGSKNLEDAIDWCLAEMKKDGFKNVRGEAVRVPRWVRGKESAEMTAPRHRKLPMLGLGGSIGTPKEGITAEVLVVSGFDDLKKRAAEAKGKIVLFNVPFTEYRETVIVRTQGAIQAARAGAVASLIRSVGPFSMQTPHTGGMSYANGVKKIPHAALSLEDANMLTRMAARGEKITVRLKMEAHASRRHFAKRHC